jgi:3-deoxy-D-manno-octulosonic-acid transferase
MLILYSLALLLLLLVAAPWWLFRMTTSGKYREGLTERLGLVPQRISGKLDERQVVWVHAVSVGEVLAASRLIGELDAAMAEAGARRAHHPGRVMISTTTRTGQALARQRFGADRVFYFPLDFGWAVRAWLQALQPRMLVLVETEFWPRVLIECRRAKIPVAVVNARISDRSWPRYRRLRRMWRPLLGPLAIVLAQTELDAERLAALGAGNVRVAGNLKYDVRAPGTSMITDLLRRSLPHGVRVLVCGSTVTGEEELLLNALPPEAVTILAPRHPERFDDVAELLKKRGLRWVRRSEWAQQPVELEPGTVFLLDSIGELASVYSLANAAFIGGSLVASGGHNPLEAAQFGVPVAMGSSYENFRGIVEKLREHEAIRIVERDALSAALKDMLAGKPASLAMGARGRKVFDSEAGATRRAVQALMALLGEDGVNPAVQQGIREEARQ